MVSRDLVSIVDLDIRNYWKRSTLNSELVSRIPFPTNKGSGLVSDSEPVNSSISSDVGGLYVSLLELDYVTFKGFKII